jgi:hypothetical protein
MWALPNGLEMSRPASSRILLDEPSPQLAGSAPSSCWADSVVGSLGCWERFLYFVDFYEAFVATAQTQPRLTSLNV